MTGESFSIGEALRFGWDAFKRNIAIALALGVASLAIMMLLNGIVEATRPHGMLSLAFRFVAQLAQIGFGFLWVRLALGVYDGRHVDARELWPDATMFLEYLAVSIIYGVLVAAGLILLVVPGIYLAVRYGLASFLVADGRVTDVLGAFRQSSELTRGRRLKLFLFGLVLVLMNVAGAILLGVGLLVTLPVTAFAAALVYRQLATRAAHEQWLAGPPSELTV
jgi:uncharacterized membrane protein